MTPPATFLLLGVLFHCHALSSSYRTTPRGFTSSSEVTSEPPPDQDRFASPSPATSFISRGPDGLAAEARHRQFGPAELARLFRSAGCQNDEIILLCKDVNETIVIENANFYSLPQMALNCSHGPLGPLESNANPHIRDTFFPQLLGLPRTSRNLRLALNSRCSGLGKGEECSFNLGLDHPQARHWGAGLIDIFYRCAPMESTHKECERDAKVRADPSGQSQFLMSPVYPKYYLGGRRCKWALRAAPGQRIQLRFLDISLRERMSSSDPECTDSISVSERGKTLLRMCGESSEDIMLLSEGHTLEVKMDTRTKTIYPRRGILAEFWPLGCPTQSEPADGYLQFRNDTHATYSCSLGHVFLPGLDRTRAVRCMERTWDLEIGNCFSIEFLRKYGNSTILELLDNKTSLGLLPSYSPNSNFYPNDQSNNLQRVLSGDDRNKHHLQQGDWFSETVLPVVIGGVLVILSLFAVLVLLLLRRHLQLEDSMIGVGVGHYSMDEDRSALTPGSVRRGAAGGSCGNGELHSQQQQLCPPPVSAAVGQQGQMPQQQVLHLDVGRQLQALQQRERDLQLQYGGMQQQQRQLLSGTSTFREEQLFSC